MLVSQQMTVGPAPRNVAPMKGSSMRAQRPSIPCSAQRPAMRSHRLSAGVQRNVRVQANPVVDFLVTLWQGQPRVLTGPEDLGELELKTRVVHASMARFRVDPGTFAPNDNVITYYEQRATNGALIVSECLSTAESAKAAKPIKARVSGLWNKPQIEGWKQVVKAVHAKGGYMYAQLFHPGRVSHSAVLPAGRKVVAPSPVQIAGKVTLEDGSRVDYEVPAEATLELIAETIKDHAEAARIAINECKFDGVEIHAGNGYLLQNFTCLSTNKRTDKYGGSVENRCRLLLETVDAVVAAIGASKTAVKLMPGITLNDQVESEEEVIELLKYLGPELSKRNLAYVCLGSLNGDPYFRFVGMSKPNVSFDIFKFFRPLYQGTYMINGGVTLESGREYVADGTADFVAYGVPFVANANLCELAAAGYTSAQLQQSKMADLFSVNPAKDAQGYIDFPLVKPTKA